MTSCAPKIEPFLPRAATRTSSSAASLSARPHELEHLVLECFEFHDILKNQLTGPIGGSPNMTRSRYPGSSENIALLRGLALSTRAAKPWDR